MEIKKNNNSKIYLIYSYNSNKCMRIISMKTSFKRVGLIVWGIMSRCRNSLRGWYRKRNWR